MVANINFNKNVVGTPVLDSAGDTVTYSFSILNEGPDNIFDLQLSDTILPVGVSLDLQDAVNAGTVVRAGDDGDNILEVGETWTFTEAAGSDIFTYTLTQADLDSNGTAEPDPVGTPDLPGQIDNEAVIVARNEAGQIIAAAREGAAAGITVNPDIAIDKEFVNFTGGNGNQLGDAVGDVLNYTVTVTNTGNVTLTGVTVVDPLTGQNISGVTLAPGASQVFNSSYVLTQADLDGAGNAGSDIDIDNTATADSNETPPVDDEEEVPLVQTPGLAVNKVVQDVDGGGPGGSVDEAGDVITYDLTVTNTGNVTLTNVTVVDPLTGTNVNIGPLAVGASFTVQDQTYTALQSDINNNGGGDGDIDNTTTADSDQTGPATDSEDVPIIVTPGLAVDKVVQDVDGGGPGGSVDEAGDVITYDLTVTNTGNVTLTNVTVVDPLTGTNVNIGPLAVGASFTVQDQTYTALQSDINNNGGGDGDIDNTTTADSDQTGPATDSEDVPIIVTPGLAVDKVVQDVDGGGPGGSVDEAGDVITYDLTVTNTGNVTLTNVTVVDPLTGTNVNIGPLAVGASFTVQDQTYTALQSDIDNNGGGDGDIDNTTTADSDQTGPATDSEDVPIIRVPGLAVDKVVQDVDGGGPGGSVDEAGDVITYDLTVTNTGNVTLTNVTVVDPLTGTNVNIGPLAVGASFTVQDQTYTALQSDIDNNGGGDGDIDNTTTADSDQTGPATDSEDVPIIRVPGLAVDKVVQDVDGGGPGGSVDEAGDVITYDLTVTNTGNVTLTNVTVVDPLTGTNVNIGPLAVGASFTVQDQTYTALQSDIDNNGGGDGDIDNTTTADSDQTGPATDSEDVPIIRVPGLAVDKVVQDVDGAGPGGSVDEAGDVITYDLTVTNTGNVTLTNVTVVDPLTGTNVNIGPLAVGASFTVQDQTYTALQSDIDNNGGGDGDIDNTTTADSDQTGPATDSEDVPIIQPPEGPGVRTPGFWQNPNNGGQFWDGIPGNEDHAGEPGFPEGELLYQVDSNCDDVLDNTAGLLIGDYNQNGLTDANEDTLFISLANAQALVGQGGGSDGVQKVGRDVVATWLNFLAGNDIDNPGTGDPQHFIDDAIDWLQVYGDASPLNINNPLEDCDVYSSAHTAVKSSSAAWNDEGFLDHSASEIHSALDQYNNTGFIV